MAGELKPLPRTPWNPLSCSDTPMEPNALLVAKLAFIALVADRFFLHVGQPFAPFIESLSQLRAVPAFGLAVQAAFWVSGLALLLNRGVRLACCVCGCVVLWTQYASRPALSSHALLLGFLIVIAALETQRQRPVLLRWQMMVVFVAAFVGKVVDPLWRDGTVVAGWIEAGMAGPLFGWMAGVQPPFATAAGLSWFIMLAQFAVACGLALPSLRARTARLAVVVQLALLFIVPNEAMAAWTIAIGIGLVSCLDWPRGALRAHWPRGCGWPLWLRIAFDRYDWDHRIVWPLPPDPEGDLEVECDGARTSNWKAVRTLLLHFPAFYAAVLLVLLGVHLLLPPGAAAIIIPLVGAALWAFLTIPAFGRLLHRPH